MHNPVCSTAHRRTPVPLQRAGHRPPRQWPAGLPLSLLGLAALLTACGSGGDDSAAPAAAPAPAPVAQAVSVIDGAIQGALVCLDKNGNGACDSGEPQGTTAADGSVTLTVDAADAGKYPVLALVGKDLTGIDAVDADHGPVTTAYSLSAPASQPAVVSPLTTLVVAQAAAAGISAAEAETAVRESLGISGSLFADYTKAAAGDATAAHAATVARLLVVTTQQQLADTAGTKAADGSALSRADRASAVQASLLATLPSVAQQASQPEVAAAFKTAVDKSASASDKAAAVATLRTAASSVAVDTGLSKDTIAATVAVAKLPPAPDSTEAPAAGLTLRWFSFSNASTYNLRMFKATAAQNTVTGGQRQFTEYREQARPANGFYQQWGEGLNNWPRNQMVWTGSEWFDCPTDHVHQATPWNASGQSDSVYCKAFKGTNKRAERDISGKTLLDIVTEIRAYPGTDTAGSYAAWGPDPAVHASALGSTFPAGSKLYYYTSADVVNPEAYNTTSTDLAVPYVAAVAGGVKAECDKVNSSNSARFLVTGDITLEQVIAGATGTPCVYGPTGTPSGETANEWWSNSTLGIGDVSLPYANATGFYVPDTKRLRVSFAAGNVANYWLCLRRASDGSSRNCTAAGSGSYRIETLGDARVLRLAGLPAVAGTLGYTRTWVERGGRVWYGYRNRLTVGQQLRLNKPATDALFAALGLPAPRTGAPLTPDSLLRQYTGYNGAVNNGGVGRFNRSALAFMPNDNSSLVGAWALSGSDVNSQTFFFFADGSYVMTDPQGDTGPSSCGGAGYEKGTVSWDPATRQLNGLSVSIDTNACAGLHDTTQATVNNGFVDLPMTITLSSDGQTASVTYRVTGDVDTLVRLSK